MGTTTMRFTQFGRFLAVGALFTAVVLTVETAALAADAPTLRQVVSLDGTWQIAEGPMGSPPKQFTRTVVVPGLVDMAQPAFVEPGPRVKDRAARPQKDPRRDAFWYRRTFQLEGSLPEVATLKIGKAMFGTRVIVNGKPVGDHLPCFTAGLFDVRGVLKRGENELLVRVGADRDAVWGRAQSGYDSEKIRYIPGIFDSVELILSGSPHIANVQAVPDVEKKSVTVHAWVRHTGAPAATKLHVTVREASTGQVAGEADCQIAADGDGPERKGQVTIPIGNCRLWSPEDPFLYDLEVRGEADALKTRFGMRTFRLDPASGRAILNGRPYYMRGSSTTVYRLFEDSQRGDTPWREEWVRRLHRRFKDMHWNSLRYCIGFPPESWYRIADEEGLLIQDEFPIWYCMPKPGDLTATNWLSSTRNGCSNGGTIPASCYGMPATKRIRRRPARRSARCVAWTFLTGPGTTVGESPSIRATPTRCIPTISSLVPTSRFGCRIWPAIRAPRRGC